MDSSNIANIYKSTLHNPTININQQAGSSTEPPLKKVKLDCFQYRLPEITVIGRDTEAGELLELVKTHRRVVISGMGGLGKTSLAVHCARTWSPTFISNAIFVDAETNETIKTAFESLRELPEINIREYKDPRVQVEQIYKTFGEGTTLIVFDNVTSFLTIKGYLPSREKDNFYIIITAQLREFDDMYHMYNIPLMKEESCFKLIQEKFNVCWHHVEHQTEEIKELIKKMQVHTLAIIQAVVHIKHKIKNVDKEYTIQMYLEEYKDNFNNIQFKDYWDDPYRYKSVYIALMINRKLLKGEEYRDKAETVLDCMTFLDPSDIMKDMFLYLCDSNINILNEVISLLRKYSLIDIESRSERRVIDRQLVLIHIEYINIHRLIQHTSQSMLKEQDDRYNSILRNTVKLLINSHKFFFHKHFILPHMKYLKLSDFNECYNELYSSGLCRERLTEALRRVNCEFSAVEGWTAAHYAAFETNTEMLELLKERGQSLSVVSQQNWTILHTMCLNCYKDVIYLYRTIRLIKSNLNIQTTDLNTALHIILMTKCYYYDYCGLVTDCSMCCCALELIDSGCDVTLTNKDGDTAAHLAARYRHCKVLKRLLELPGVDITQNNNKSRSVSKLAQESHVVLYRHTSQLPADVRVWYRCIPLEPLETQQARMELLKSLVEGERDVPDEVYQDIVQLLDNIPLALRMAAGYMRHRNILLTTFKQHLTTLPADTVPSPVRDSCFGYRPTNIYVLFCAVLNYLIKEHKCAFELLSYMSYTDCGISTSRFFELTDHRHSIRDIDASIKTLDTLSLLGNVMLTFWGNATWYRIEELLSCVPVTYSQMRGEERAVFRAILTSDNIDLCEYGRAPAVRALGVSGVEAMYTERSGSAPDEHSTSGPFVKNAHT